ncbi:MAG: sporulation protein SpoIID, partial [Oscillospiraceae bacterium]|nr:sporulation protein SpoIID [Oscillospiraceae bacterium]
MKQKFVQFAALCLSAFLLVATGGRQGASASAPDTAERVIRVGLHHDGSYGTGTMEGLNLQNVVGSGFRFGYYDSASRFVAIGSTAQKAISVVKTQNVYYGTHNKYTSYHSALTSSAVAVGIYHLQLPGSYGSFEGAQAAAAQYRGGFPAYIEGKYYVRMGCYTTSGEAKAAQEALGAESTLSWTSKYAVSVVITGTNTIVFQYDDNGSGTGLGIEPVSTAGEKCSTLSKEYVYNGGFRFERINGGDLTVVNIVGLEDYVKGVVPYEMS